MNQLDIDSIPIENFHPILRKGRLIPQGTKLIFETESPLRQVVLPIELAEFLSRCNGQQSVRSIIESLHRQKRVIPFKLIYRAIYYLKVNQILENGEELSGDTVNMGHRFRFPFLNFRPLFSISLGRRIYNDSANPLLYYTISMAIIILSLYGIADMPGNIFSNSLLNLNGSYSKGMLMIFVSASLMLSIKNLSKLVLLLVLTGRAYNFSLVYNGFACYFKVGADSLFLISNRLYLTLFHVSMTLCYFSFAWVLSFVIPNAEMITQLYIVSFIITLSDLNPFVRSELSQYINSIYKENGYGKNSSLIFKNKDGAVQGLISQGMSGPSVVFAIWALFWVGVTGAFLVSEFTLQENLLTKAEENHSSTEIISWVVAMASLLVAALLVLSYFFKIVYFKFVRELIGKFSELQVRRQRLDIKNYDMERTISVLEKLPLLATFSISELEFIFFQSQISFHPARSYLIHAGEKGESLYVLLEGSLEIQKPCKEGQFVRVATIDPPTIVGEVAVIENSLRTANVKVIKPSLIMNIPAKVLRDLALNSPTVGQIQNFRNAIIVSQFFASAPIFKDLTEETIHLLLTQGKIEHYTAHEVVYRPEDESDGFYLLVRGAVNVSVGNQVTERVRQGGFFGEISVLTEAKRTELVRAEESSMVLKITSALFWEILVKDIEMAMIIESVGESRYKENNLALKKEQQSA